MYRSKFAMEVGFEPIWVPTARCDLPNSACCLRMARCERWRHFRNSGDLLQHCDGLMYTKCQIPWQMGADLCSFRWSSCAEASEQCHEFLDQPYFHWNVLAHVNLIAPKKHVDDKLRKVVPGGISSFSCHEYTAVPFASATFGNTSLTVSAWKQR